jgi:threonine/homoserine/homoserine lactone efflux protein
VSATESLLAVAAVWLVAVITPGPNALYFTAVALSSSARATVAAGAGVVFGTLLWGAAGLLGLMWLLDRFPAVAFVLKFAGAAYLAWIGLGLLRKALVGAASPEEGSRPDSRPITARRAFITALLTNLGNPKTLVFVSSLFAVSRLAEQPALTGVAGVALMAAMSTLYYTCFGTLLRRTARSGALDRTPAGRLVQGAVAVMMIAFGGKLAVRP